MSTANNRKAYRTYLGVLDKYNQRLQQGHLSHFQMMNYSSHKFWRLSKLSS
jgi:hypothetical protein